jgi:hypothetical protein
MPFHRQKDGAFIVVFYCHGVNRFLFRAAHQLPNGKHGRDQIPLLNADSDQRIHEATIISRMAGNRSATS